MIEGFVSSDVFVATASCPFHRSQYLQFLCNSTGKKRYQKKKNFNRSDKAPETSCGWLCHPNSFLALRRIA